MELKYGTWNVSSYRPADVRVMVEAGFSPLTAAVMCSRGYTELNAARDFLAANEPLSDPFTLLDMDKAARRVRRAIDRREQICVFGDYDVDGITATCLLTDFLRRQGARVVSYIPARLEEGYGLNEMALHSLREQNVQLIVTVDCGITANDEAALCRALGMELVITDHHECNSELPEAVAVVDPHRLDQPQPASELAGVGVAFKLACAIGGDTASLLREYCDFLCLGTVADVMPLTGENRTMVAEGLKSLENPKRVGLAALMAECGVGHGRITAGTIGYTLAPRINAAGRMGQVDVATELFLTTDAQRAVELAAELCRMNRKRQEIEAEIYREAASMLPTGGRPEAIVLASERWHQGVVGIVASRLAEEYNCPAFLICLDGDKGKASSRSHGGFNLFAALRTLSPLLESYGGHELAAGFTIRRENIDAFRAQITELARAFRASGECQSALEIDCEIPPRLLTLENVAALDELEPCGVGCPRPVLALRGFRVEELTEVGGGKHLRLRLTSGRHSWVAIFFSTTARLAAVSVGDRVDLAFTPQINEYRGQRMVQLNLVDIRPDESARSAQDEARTLYARHRAGDALSMAEAEELLPCRKDFIAVWRYLTAHAENGWLQEEAGCLSRKIARYAAAPCCPGKTWVCLEVFAEQGLLVLEQRPRMLRIRLTSEGKKVDLEQSQILRHLKMQKAGN